MTGEIEPTAEKLYRWHWRARLPERHGQLCRLLACGKLNSCLIEFLNDGVRHVTCRHALRKALPAGAARNEAGTSDRAKSDTV